MRIAVVDSRGYLRLDLVTDLVHRLHRHATTTDRPIVAGLLFRRVSLDFLDSANDIWLK